MDSMIIERDAAIPSGGGETLRADIFRPLEGTKHPAILALTPYGKGLEWKAGFAPQWQWLTTRYPNLLPGSKRSFMVWETVDPEMWVPWGYAVVRIDARGTGRSPGHLDPFSPEEARGYYHAIEWAAAQPWCTGKVGLIGISYLAITQWLVASLQPPHLAAMVPWEGASDLYRDSGRHGGILSNVFLKEWYARQVLRVQNGKPDAMQDPWLQKSLSGADDASTTLTLDQLEKNQSDMLETLLNHPLDDEFYKSRSADWSKVIVPFLSCANWGGFGLHGRGNFEGFTQAASKQKWLECHIGRHEEEFYTDRGMALQREFLDHFLHGKENGWNKRAPVILQVRRALTEEIEVREEESWPLPSTHWTPISLDAQSTGVHNSLQLSWDDTVVKASVSFDALGEPLVFMSPPLIQPTELTGPLAAKIFASSSTTDMDLFLTLQAFSPEGREVEFQGSLDPHTPLAQGWLRASHRKLDAKKSQPYRPYHSHDEILSVEPGKVYELDIEIWPTNVILPAGFQIALHISGRDFERPIAKDANESWISRGSGPFLHVHPQDRPRDVFGGKTTIHTGGDMPSSLLLPIVHAS